MLAAKLHQLGPEWIGLAALITLLLQNTGYVLILKVSQTPPHNEFLPSTAVFMGEFMKLVICFAVLNYQGRRPWSVVEELRA